jgi:hypothetical protein
MGLQVFPEQLYTRLLYSGERIGVTSDNRFEMLPPEPFSSRLWRFFTFQQDPNFDRVHHRLQEILWRHPYDEPDSLIRTPEVSHLIDEIRAHGGAKYRYLQVNLANIRIKLDHIGRINCFSALILKVINTVFSFFSITPIQLKTYKVGCEKYIQECPMSGKTFVTYCKKYEINNDGFLRLENDWDLSAFFAKEGLELTEEDRKTCHFSATIPTYFPSDICTRREHLTPSEIRPIIQKLEKGLQAYYIIERTYKGTEALKANLEISFDSQHQRFLAAVNNSEARSVYNRQLDLNNNVIGPVDVSSSFAKYLRELPNDKKTFRYFVSAENSQGIVEHELIWVAEPTEQAPFQLLPGVPLALELETQYTFYNEKRETVFSLEITPNEQFVGNI